MSDAMLLCLVKQGHRGFERRHVFLAWIGKTVGNFEWLHVGFALTSKDEVFIDWPYVGLSGVGLLEVRVAGAKHAIVRGRR